MKYQRFYSMSYVVLLSVASVLVITDWVQGALRIFQESHLTQVEQVKSVSQTFDQVSWSLMGEHDSLIPVTRLTWELKGILYSNHSSHSQAILSLPGASDKTYHPGDRIMNQITVVAVNRDHVILEREGHRERLDLRRLG